jgi:D-aspartate ligase
MMKPWALVIGDVSLVRALGRSGLPVMLSSSEPRPAAASSRYCAGVLRTPSFIDEPEAAVRSIAAWAKAQRAPPVIFYQGDHDLLALSRNRAVVTPVAHIVLPRAELVEDLVDKLRFAALGARHGLPVPPTVTLRREQPFDDVLAAWSHFPCVIKPSLRSRWIGSALQMQDERTPKAIRVETKAELARIAPLVRAHETDCVLQAAVEGGEEQILSYHAYVRDDGDVLAEFTGRKVRTIPRRYGFSTCVDVVHQPDVQEAGREVCRKLALTGVMKMDFKRDTRDGRLYLLEINPRFNLWHHPGTVAGVSIPALVYADCVRPGSALSPGRARRSVRWLSARGDLRALFEYRRAGELSIGRWLREVVTADVNEDLFLQDPLPSLLELAARAGRRLGGLARSP